MFCAKVHQQHEINISPAVQAVSLFMHKYMNLFCERMLYLSKNSIFRLKYSHGNHVHNFENTYCVHDYFGSRSPVVRAVTLFTV